VVPDSVASHENPSGAALTVSVERTTDPGHPFFRPLGTNGRSCSTCHQPAAGWTITPPQIQARFEATQGLDPILRPVDGATCPPADVSSETGRRAAYRLLLARGLVRVSLAMPAGADFTIAAVDDPYRCQGGPAVSVYRRPLSVANARFLRSVMWDGRQTLPGR